MVGFTGRTPPPGRGLIGGAAVTHLATPCRRSSEPIEGQQSPAAAGHIEVADVVPSARTAIPPAVSRNDQEREPPAQARQSPGLRSLTGAWWPLLTILVAQAVLSLRLIWSDAAFQDEALYLRAGQLEWAHWLHHAPIPAFPAYFSGAPVVYPPLGALADSVGGLTAARLLSLCFMLGVTSLLWATTHRLYGRRAALLAAALFATLAGTQFLGAFATFDAMALFLLTLAAWLGVRSADCRFWIRIALLLTAGVTLAAADATKYATALFTPVVLVAVALAVWRRQRGGAWLTSLLTVGSSWLLAVSTAVAAAGGTYWLGITTSTLTRAPADSPVTAVLHDAYVWTSLIVVLAALGVWLSIRRKERGRFLPAVLAAAALLAPAEQARLHTTVSLQKHVVFGAWFAAIAAGYAMARLSRVDPGHGWAMVMALPIAASTLFSSMGQASFLHTDWPDATALVNVLRTATHSHPGNYLAEDDDVEAYYLRAEVPWQRWSSTYYFRYPGALPGTPSYRAAIGQHYFSLVILDSGDTAATDAQIITDMYQTGGYYILTHAGRFTIWAVRPAGEDRVRH
jgi:hypothetical protein